MWNFQRNIYVLDILIPPRILHDPLFLYFAVYIYSYVTLNFFIFAFEDHKTSLSNIYDDLFAASNNVTWSTSWFMILLSVFKSWWLKNRFVSSANKIKNNNLTFINRLINSLI